MDYKDIYNDLIDRTHGLTDTSGFYDVSDKAELQIALDILKSAYLSVQWTGLVHDANDPNGNDYRLRFSDPVLEEQVKYEPNNDISESKQMNEAMIEKHDTLNPKLWDNNNELKPEVRQKVEEIVDKFKENLEDDEVKLDVKDICLIGSNASYNYNPTSDLDIHIICDPSVYSDEDLANKIYLAYKSLWNNKYDPTFDGIEVELYVEPYEVHANSKGIYSLNDGWLKEPEAEDIPEVDENEIAILAEPFEERYEKVMQGESIKDIDNLIDDIYLQRQESIMKDGEFADGNLVFKLLRSRGRIQDLRDRKVELENKEMSITEDNFNSDLESILIEEGLVEDTIDNDLFNLEPGQVYRLGDNHTIKINDVKNNVVSCTEIDGDETYDWEDAYFPVQSMLFEYDAILEESINEDTVKQGNKWVNKGKEGTHGKFKTKKAADAQRKAMFANGYKEGLNEFLVNYDGRGMEFSFPDPKDTLAVYLDWEGIYGYNDDIIDFGSAGYDDLEAYLEEEGIFGYTQKIYDILNGEPAWCSGMNQEDFESICRANYIDPQSANDDVDIDDDVPSELPANADDEDYLDDRDESLKEGYNRLTKEFDDIEDARKFAKFLDQDLEPRIEAINTEDENGNVVTSYVVYYWDQQDFHDDELDESKPQWPKEIGREYDFPDEDDDEPRILPPNADDDDYDDEFDESLNESADRHVERGINWTWFYTDSEDDANKWFFELMGVKPNDNTIDGPIERDRPGKFDSYWSFRMRNDLVDQLDEAKYLGSCDDKKQINDEKKKGLVKKDKKSKYDIKADESLKEGLTSNDITLDQIKALPVGTIMGIDVLEDPNDPLFKDRDNYFEYRKLEDGWHTFVDDKDWFDEPSDDYTVFMALTNLNAPRVYSIDIKKPTNEDLRDELINHGANEVDTLGSMGSKNGGSVSLFYNKPKELYYVIEGPVEKKPAHEFARNNFYNLAPDTMEALKKHPEYIRFTSKDKGEAIKFIKDNYNSGWVIGEDLNEEVDPNDPKAQALALYLNVTTDAIDNGYNNGVYEIDNEEYFVGTEDEAHDMAVSEVKMSYDDMGLDAFTPRFQEWILDNAIDEGSIDEFVDNEIDYFTNEEPDQNMVDYLNGLIDEAQYVKDTLGPDTFKDWAKDKIDLDKVAEEAIEEDGVAHFIAYYDGNEIDLGDGLYAYRLD